MSSTGNDIVALNEYVIAKATQPRFYAKILSAREKELYDELAEHALSLGEYVWLQWSVKEAVYKWMKRMQPALRFAPQKINVHQLQSPAAGHDESWRCTVSFGAITIYTQTWFHSSFLHTIAACNNNFTGSYWGVGAVSSADYRVQSAGCRSLLADKIHTLLPGKTMVFQKNAEGVPLLLEENTGTPIPVSFSHDDCFAGYSFYLQAKAEASAADKGI